MVLNRRSRWSALATATVVVLLAGGLVSLRGGSTPVSPESAVARFRSQQQVSLGPEKQVTTRAPGASGAAATKQVQARVTTRASDPGLRPRPAEGVYVYATTGGDEVDVLGGSRHTYPDETTITVSHTGCGVVERWDALEERWDERESCRTSGGEILKRMTSIHEFFGRSDQRTLHCTGYTYPAGFEPGASWKTSCASENVKAETTLTAVGWEDVDIGGTRVRTMHVNAKTRVTGEQNGTSERDVWGSRDDGIVVRERTTLTSFSNQPVLGRTRYHESYEIRLTSVEPRR